MTRPPTGLDLPGPSRRIVVEPLVLPEPARDPAVPSERPGRDRDAPEPAPDRPVEAPAPA